MKNILVYGFYHHANIGDLLFVEAFRSLFPGFNFVFVDRIEAKDLQDVAAVFFGGGSFLLDRPYITDDALRLLKTKKIFYLGVGIETNIHPIHLQLMSKALLVATRSPDQVAKLKSINSNSLFAPDLVYCLQNQVVINPKHNNSVLVMTNISVVPRRDDPHWKHAAWNYFKSEFSQFLDWLIDGGYKLRLFSMCRDIQLNDDWASAELISHMSHRDSNHIIQQYPEGIVNITSLLSEYGTIITQRFHGIVLSEMIRVPYVAIHHHDKLKFSQPAEGKFLSYYNSSKHSYIEAFNQARCMNYDAVLPIKSNEYEVLVNRVINLL